MTPSKPLTTKVYHKVYEDVINGTITSQDIITESMLIKELGVSKSPVREALIELCNEDILRAIPRMGYMVVHITPQEIRELGEAREALELYMLEKSFSLLGEEEIEALEKLNQTNLKEAETKCSPMDNWQRNMKFHLTLAALSHNKVLYSLLEQVLKKLTRATTQHFAGLEPDNPLSKEEIKGTGHFDLISAFKERNLDDAKAILKKDIRVLKY